MRLTGLAILGLVVVVFLALFAIIYGIQRSSGGNLPGSFEGLAEEGSTTGTTRDLWSLDEIVFDSVPQILDPSNRGWPRTIRGIGGPVVISKKPERIITASVGHDELTLALVPAHRLVGVGQVSKNPLYSNISDRVQDITIITRDPEVILKQNPDIVVTSPFLDREIVNALSNVGLTVVTTALTTDLRSQINNILLLGYIYGEENRALSLAREIQSRYQDVSETIKQIPIDLRPRVAVLTSYSDKIWTAGTGSTEGAIIDLAGGVNVAAEAGIVSNNTISVESVIAMSPEVIIIPMPNPQAVNLKNRLLANPVLGSVPAIKSSRVFPVSSTYFTTLSFWNILGIEQLAALLWPNDYQNYTAKGFSLP